MRQRLEAAALAAAAGAGAGAAAGAAVGAAGSVGLVAAAVQHRRCL